MRLLGWLRYVATPRSYPRRWQDRLFQGHISVGPVVVYGANAMHWAINVKAFGYWWCLHPRTRTFGVDWPAYFYVSVNGTPSRARFSLPRRKR